MTTTDLIAQAEALCAAATPGPWKPCGNDRGGCICGMVWSTAIDQVVATANRDDPDMPSPDEAQAKHNAAFIAGARTLLPDLAARLKATAAMLTRTADYLETATELVEGTAEGDEDDIADVRALIAEARALLAPEVGQ